MKESVAIAKEADTMSSPTKSDNSICRVRNEPERQLGSLKSVINNIRRDGGTPSVDSIATELSGMHTAQRAPVLMALQRTQGNRYVQRVVTGIQAKLKVGQPGDIYEQEADRVADAVMRMPEPQMQRRAEEAELIQTKPLADQITPLVQRQVEEEEEEKKKEKEEIIQTKESLGQTLEVTSDLESRIPPLREGGQPLPKAVRAFFEPRFGYDFSRVRVHSDAQAAESVRAVNAKAYTLEQNVVFGAGQYVPETGEGRRLLAHELTHVVQQTSGVKRKLTISQPTDKYEREVDQIARVVMQGKQQITLHKADEEMMRRQTEGERKEEENFPVKTATLRIPWTNNYDEFLRIAERDVQDKLEIPPDRIESLMGSSNLIDVYMQIEYEKRLGRVGKAVKIDVRLVPVGVKTNRLIFYWPRTRYKEVESVVLPEEKRGIIAQIYFAFDSSLLDHKDKEVIGDAIQILKKKLKEKKAKDVIVKGYTDVIGTRDYNLDLSERRAKEVADILKSSLADTGGLILEVGLGEQGTDKDTEDIRSRNRRVDISYYQPTYEKGRQPKRPRRGWSEMPWTEQELQSFKNEEFNEVSKYPVWENQESELIRVLEERYFIGEQVIKNWNNRYGKWYDSGLNDKWANWFCNRMLDSCPNGYPISLNRQGRKQLWEDFWKALKVAGEEYGRRTAGGRAISGIKDVKYLHDWCRSEYEERDPTSLEFNINYRDFIKFEITDQSLKRLTSKGVPNEVIDQLKYTESVGVIEGEKRFLEFVRTFIGDEYYDKYKFMIWRQALTRRRVEPTKAAQKKDKDIPWALGPMSNKELEAKIKELGDEIEELERERTK